MGRELRQGQVVTGRLFNGPMRVESISHTDDGTWRVGLVGAQTEKFRSVSLSAADLSELVVLESCPSFEREGHLLRLGLQAYSLDIAFEFDSFFGLSVSRVDPLPHQLEAVYDDMLKLPRIHFLLADDAGAGKTIMAGLLLRELKLRGLADRTLIVCLANLAFQWHREMKEKFDEKFFVMRGFELRAHPALHATRQCSTACMRGCSSRPAARLRRFVQCSRPKPNAARTPSASPTRFLRFTRKAARKSGCSTRCY
jgi:hypothetical protein